ncbi:hypothetical protein CGLO_14784 [Colletotrichum gloeosporioides Cg-14]|uniref:Uncharacterized protein n=1 Tax=Colletotrichum gloeosporioides (strain Cg-14) TaxID=1237896 RepID=T0K062_COLGC|nr:hypothetical protein CGLO_14784 [Colletotrichum gloeosporioides Cg-14]
MFCSQGYRLDAARVLEHE